MFLPSKVLITRLERPARSRRVVSSNILNSDFFRVSAISTFNSNFSMSQIEREFSQKRKLSSLLNIERLFSGLKGVKTSCQKLKCSRACQLRDVFRQF